MLPPAAAGNEIELKLLAAPESLTRLEALTAGPVQKRTLVTVYWDTPALDLSQARVALRLRQEAGQWIYTLKTLDRPDRAGETSVPVRREWEWPGPADGIPDVAALAGHPALAGILPRDTGPRIRPLFHSCIHRTQWEHPSGDGSGSVVEVALDRGEIRAGGPGDPGPAEIVSEVELELRRGPVAALFALALTFHVAAPLTLARDSKAETGYRLATGRARPPLPPLGPAPAAGAAGQGALLAWLRAGLVRLSCPETSPASLAALSAALATCSWPGAAALAAQPATDLTAWTLRLGLWLEQTAG